MIFAPIDIADLIKELAPLVTALGVLLTVIMSWRAANRAALTVAAMEATRLIAAETAAKVALVDEKTEAIKKATDGITTALVKATGEKERLLGKIEGKAEEKANVAKKAEIISDIKNGLKDDQT